MGIQYASIDALGQGEVAGLYGKLADRVGQIRRTRRAKVPVEEPQELIYRTRLRGRCESARQILLVEHSIGGDAGFGPSRDHPVHMPAQTDVVVF